MKRYRVQVNGKSYEVEVEEVAERATAPAAPSKPAAPKPRESAQRPTTYTVRKNDSLSQIAQRILQIQLDAQIGSSQRTVNPAGGLPGNTANSCRTSRNPGRVPTAV